MYIGCVFAGMMIIAIIFIFIIQKYQYQKTSYYKVTKNSLLKVRNDKGLLGEYLIYKLLQNYEKNSGKFLFNCYIPKGRDGTTEIDVLLIYKSGIFVFESKNYSGWIFGSEKARTWMQTLPQGKEKKARKESFLNPILQNKLHINCLKDLIGNKVPIYSVVVFSDRCTFKKMEISPESKIKVTKRNKITNIVKELEKNSFNIMSEDDINTLYNKLYPFTQVSDALKQEHIDQIHRP